MAGTVCESLDPLQVLLDSMPENIYFKDADGRFTRISRSLARFLGVSDPREVVGKTDSDFFPREDADRYRQVELEIMRSGRPLIRKEERCVARDGRVTWYLTTKVPISDGAGNVIGIAGLSNDVTVRKQTEVALRESEERFRRVYESSLLGIHFWNAAGEVTQANDAYLNMIGYSAEDLAARRVRWRDLTPPEYAPIDDRALQGLRQDGVCPPFEKEYIRKDGRRIPVLLGAALLPDSQHEGVAYALDLTVLKRAERELQQQRQEQEIILDSVPAMIWYKDRENRIIRTNAVAAASRGLPKDQIEGKSTYDLYPEFAHAYHQDDLEVINSGRPKMGIIEPLVETASGEKRWLRTDKIPYRDERGEIIGVIVFATDITDLKEAEEALRREQQLMQILMDNMPDAIYFKDRESHFLRTNLAHARIMGIADPQEAIGRADSDFFRPEDAAAFRADEQDVMERGESLVGLLERHSGGAGASGEMRWWSTTKVPVRGVDGEVVGIAGITRDVTQLKTAEENIQRLNEDLERRVIDRTAKLAAANRWLETEIAERREAERKIHTYQERLRSLASEISLAEERERRHIAVGLHDQVAQTLALIQIKLQEMRKTVPDGELARELDACVQLIHQPIHDTRTLMFNLSPPVLYAFGLKAAAAWLVEQQHGRNGLSVTFEDDEQPKPLDQTVSVLLFRAIRELLTNVVKHSHAQNACVWLEVDGPTLRAGVEDDGRGFDTRNLGGDGDSLSGFGLFSIREQLERVGGTMRITSTRDAGSRIILTVPLQDQTTAAVARQYKEMSMTTTILLVDDHQTVTDGLRAVLEREPDFRVVGTAINGRIAVERALELKPDIVVMDVEMQVLNGMEATRQIVAALPGIKVIALSTYANRQFVIEMFKAGAVAYLLKHSAAAELVRAIRAAQNNQQVLGEGIPGVLIDYVRDGAASGASAFTTLTPREREILQLVAEGRSSREIADHINRSESTVETCRRNISRKLDLHSVAELTRYAIREGLTTA